MYRIKNTIARKLTVHHSGPAARPLSGPAAQDRIKIELNMGQDRPRIAAAGFQGGEC